METNKTAWKQTRILTETTRTYIGGSIVSLVNRTGKLDLFLEEKKKKLAPPYLKKKALKIENKM